MNKILIVGQVPPPFGGQAIMIDALIRIFINEPNVHHVGMSFSKDLDSMGKFKFSKIVEFGNVIYKIWKCKVKKKPNILYFPPTGGGSKLPFYRDALLLVCTRFLFKKTIFHFHASGLNELYSQLNIIEKFLFKIAYNKPSISIIMSSEGIKDPLFIFSQKIEIIPNGIPVVSNISHKENNIKITTNLLFVGLICESKGVTILLHACLILKKKNIDFKLNIVGKFESNDYESFLRDFVKSNKLEHNVSFTGVLTGKSKHQVFLDSDIFCFPTFFEHENFPLVILEAMMYGLTTVTTNWRSIPQIIKNNQNGIICPIKSPKSIAESILFLMLNQPFRIKLGNNAQKDFHENYTLDKFSSSMRLLFNSIKL